MMNAKFSEKRQAHTIKTRPLSQACVLILSILLWGNGGTLVYGVPPAEEQEQGKARALIHESAQAIEYAWEEFHQAAIGGTLASPAVQSRIEHQLHEVRALLMQARQAERAGQHVSVKSLTQDILKITQDIVHASREKKQ
jgi:hypothetical protein